MLGYRKSRTKEFESLTLRAVERNYYSLDTVQWISRSPDLFSSVKKLVEGGSLKNFHILGFDSVLKTFVSRCALNLTDFTIRNCTFCDSDSGTLQTQSLDDLAGTKSAVSPLSYLSRFYYAGSQGEPTDFISHLVASTPSFHHLKELKISLRLPNGGNDMPDSFSKVIALASSTLESLTITIHSSQWGSPNPTACLGDEGYSYFGDVDFSMLVHLRRLSLDLRTSTPGNSKLLFLSPLFHAQSSTPDSSPVNTIAICIRLPVSRKEPMLSTLCATRDQWNQLDEDLTSARFSKLVGLDITAHIIFCGWGDEPFDILEKDEKIKQIEEEIHDNLRQNLPKLHNHTSVHVNLSARVFEEIWFYDIDYHKSAF